MDAVDVARYARHIALPEIGPEGQARICAARVAVVGTDLAAETSATYLRAAGVTSLFTYPELAPSLLAKMRQAKGADAERWRALVSTVDAEGWRGLLSSVDLVVRSGFDDDAMIGAAAQLGLPVIVVRAQRDGVDMVVFGRRPPSPDATVAVPVAAESTPDDGPAAVLAGTLAAAEALWILAGRGEPAPPIRHVCLPLDGREPLVQTIGSPT